LIVEEVSGQSYIDYVTQHIFEPLDMRHSFLSHDYALADGLSDGHHYMFGRAFTTERAIPPAGIPSGGLIASAEDMSHYTIAQLNEGEYDGVTILSPQGIEELHAPAIASGSDGNHYAMGWNAGTVDGMPAVWHGGDLGNFRAFIILMPERESGFVLLTNATGYEQMSKIEQVAVGVFRMLNGRPVVAISSLPFGPRFLYWAIPLTLVLQIFGIVLGWWNRQRIRGRGVLLTVILNLGAILFLFGLARLVPFPLPSMLVFFPEVGYGLIGIATLGIGWSFIYTMMYLVERRSKQSFVLDQQSRPNTPATAR